MSDTSTPAPTELPPGHPGLDDGAIHVNTVTGEQERIVHEVDAEGNLSWHKEVGS